MEIADLSSLTEQTVKISVGIRSKKKYPVIPVFFPFTGCPYRCVFCAQTAQTGYCTLHTDEALARLEAVLDSLTGDDTPCEVAFYGGTFTLWPRDVQVACLRLVLARLGSRCVGIRCSTRPDALDPDWLPELRAQGLNMIELGVQSFDDTALAMVWRGYGGKEAVEGCRRVRAAGMACGVQLMPGMPGGTPDSFLRDVRIALESGAACLRFYPCLVLESTELADWWRAGRYAPWKLEPTIRILGQGLALAWEAGVPVIRMGLAPGPELEAAVLAGPYHPALGSLVQAEALALTVEHWAKKAAAVELALAMRLPRACKGFMGGRDAPVWERLRRVGITRESIVWGNEDHGYLSVRSPLSFPLS